jgi:uncharacterized DUF497 family protein
MVRRVGWNPEKAERNWQKHGVYFEEAETVFRDPLITSMPDPDHSDEEDRYAAMGTSGSHRLLIVIYTVRDDEARLISAWVAPAAQRRRYMRGDMIRDKAAVTDDVPDRREYDFTNAVRGLHYIAPRGIVRVSIDEDVASYYSTDDSVNDALRMLIAEGRAPGRRSE